MLPLITVCYFYHSFQIYSRAGWLFWHMNLDLLYIDPIIVVQTLFTSYQMSAVPHVPIFSKVGSMHIT